MTRRRDLGRQRWGQSQLNLKIGLTHRGACWLRDYIIEPALKQGNLRVGIIPHEIASRKRSYGSGRTPYSEAWIKAAVRELRRHAKELGYDILTEWVFSAKYDRMVRRIFVYRSGANLQACQGPISAPHIYPLEGDPSRGTSPSSVKLDDVRGSEAQQPVVEQRVEEESHSDAPIPLPEAPPVPQDPPPVQPQTPANGSIATQKPARRLTDGLTRYAFSLSRQIQSRYGTEFEGKLVQPVPFDVLRVKSLVLEALLASKDEKTILSTVFWAIKQSYILQVDDCSIGWGSVITKARAKLGTQRVAECWRMEKRPNSAPRKPMKIIKGERPTPSPGEAVNSAILRRIFGEIREEINQPVVAQPVLQPQFKPTSARDASQKVYTEATIMDGIPTDWRERPERDLYEREIARRRAQINSRAMDSRSRQEQSKEAWSRMNSHGVKP